MKNSRLVVLILWNCEILKCFNAATKAGYYHGISTFIGFECTKLFFMG